MNLKKFAQAAAVSMVVMATPSLASEVRLSCPEGTVQKGKTTQNESVYCIKPNSKPGEQVIHGPYVDFWANGQKQAEGQYLNGFRSGRWTFWDANGVKTGETEFVAGDYHGTRVQYFANGKPKMIEQYRKGFRNGTVQELSEDGKVIRQLQFADGREVASR
ncbi:toxin-antitoxin system YwqK family antitoxin [Corallococcus exercitus]|uniref:toxin-antitoxin system YwqK family antitoxin n=1 Tax=Corallococcus exercitus TaxID=2316736 RepID=UPI0035D44675